MDINKIADASVKTRVRNWRELKQSLAEVKAGTIGRQYTPAQRLVREVRKAIGFSQVQFARTINTPVGSVRDWEQGRFEPPGAVTTLMKVIKKHPEVIKEIA